MRARVERNRIIVVLEGDEVSDLRLRTILQSSFGSARLDVEHDLLSCALSTTNFRKLRELGCRLDTKDEDTLETVQEMKERYQAFMLESRQGDLAKMGQTYSPEYRFKLPPFAHQRLGFEFLHSTTTPALFGDCGTGKTYLVTTFAESLIQSGEKIVFLVFCPINLIQHVWLDEVKKFTDLTAVNLRDTRTPTIRVSEWDEGADRTDPAARKKAMRRAKRRFNSVLNERFEQDADIYVLNLEGLRTEPRERRVRKLLERKTEDGYQVCLVVDESSRIKTRTSRAYKVLKRLRRFCSRCIILTGTPSPNGILDLWAQFDILDHGQTLQPSFVDFRADTHVERPIYNARYTDRNGERRMPMGWEPRATAAEEVYAAIEPRMIRFKLESCIDLPDHRFVRRNVELGDKQQTAYDEMENMLFTELEEEPVTAKVAASKLMKLREITGGFLITDESEEISFGEKSPKLVELDTLLSQSVANQMGDQGVPNKALIWANYQWECKTLVERYRSKYGARGIFGGISQSERDRSIRAFKDRPDCRILVCHPGSAGHGLTLTEANYAFYYSLSYNFEEFYQSFRRMTRPGQTRAMTYYLLVANNTIDEQLIEALRSKKDLSDLITDGRVSRDSFLGDDVADNNQFNMTWEVPNENQTTGVG